MKKSSQKRIIKEYIRQYYADHTKEIMNIRLHMLEVKMNYKKDVEDIKC